MKVLCVVGARPNFMKVAPVLRAIHARTRLEGRLVHTGQHYDTALSRVFFDDLGLPRAIQAELDLDRGLQGLARERRPARAHPGLAGRHGALTARSGRAR